MKDRFKNYAKLSISILCVCFAINVRGQDPCVFATGEEAIAIFEKCVDSLRLDYDSMEEQSILEKHKKSKNDIYNLLVVHYKTLTDHYDTRNFFNDEKLVKFRKKDSTLILKKD